MGLNLTMCLLVVGLVSLAGCATGGSKFGKIYPGMKRDQVVQVLGKGPSTVKQYESNYAAWYYGDDRCLLFKGDEVASKSETREDQKVDVFGYGAVKERRLASCLPPGSSEKQKVEREIKTPFGTVKH